MRPGPERSDAVQDGHGTLGKRIAITGASGAIGRHLVPYLSARGFDLLLVGRDPERLHALFPAHACVDYDNLSSSLEGCHAVVHLAVLNTNRSGSSEEFDAVNARLPATVALAAREAGVSRFIHVTTLRALDLRRTDPYSASKRHGEAALAGIDGIDVTLLRLPAVHGEGMAGRLRRLERLPQALRHIAVSLLSALTPVAGVDTVCAVISARASGFGEGADLVSDGWRGGTAYLAAKRFLDLGFVAAVALLLGWWLFPLVWAAIRLSSGGPAVFAQERVGQRERPFICYKFRTMRTGTVSAATHTVSASAVTPVGRFLRRTKIDELPQIWNILRNEMSLVGPRPCLTSQHELIEWRRRLGVLEIKQGLTGLAQVRGIDMSNPERLARQDAEYRALRTIPLDLRIVLSTMLARGGGDRTAK